MVRVWGWYSRGSSRWCPGWCTRRDNGWNPPRIRLVGHDWSTLRWRPRWWAYRCHIDRRSAESAIITVWRWGRRATKSREQGSACCWILGWRRRVFALVFNLSGRTIKLVNQPLHVTLVLIQRNGIRINNTLQFKSFPLGGIVNQFLQFLIPSSQLFQQILLGQETLLGEHRLIETAKLVLDDCANIHSTHHGHIPGGEIEGGMVGSWIILGVEGSTHLTNLGRGR